MFTYLLTNNFQKQISGKLSFIPDEGIISGCLQHLSKIAVQKQTIFVIPIPNSVSNLGNDYQNLKLIPYHELMFL